jgi:hypothetical protein
VPQARADLTAVAAELAGAFPLVLERTSLVLLDVDPNHLHAFWTLAQDDLERVRTAFPTGGGTPQLVVCLRRRNDQGGTEVVTCIPLAGAQRGDARFALTQDDGAYQAEVGLRNPNGGWALLVRSNQARLPRPVGIEIPAWDGVEPEPPAEVGQPTQPQTEAPETGTLSALAVVDGQVIEAAGIAVGAAPRRDWAMGQPPAPGTRPALWVLAAAAAGRELDVVGQAQIPTADAGLPRGPDVQAQGLEGQPADLWAPEPASDTPTHAFRPAEPVPESESLSWVQESRLEDTGREQGDSWARHQPQPPGPISSFALGEGPEAPVIDAELLVRIRARPGTLVDLFGRPLRVSPSGETTLRVPVTDLALVAKLLEILNSCEL